VTEWRDPSPIQAAFLNSFLPVNCFIGGRGAGKTAVLVKKAEMLARMSPGIIIILTEQTSADIADILEPCWASMVPSEFYISKGSEGKTTKLFHNGSQVWFRSRHAKNHSSPAKFQGPTVGWIGHDELSLDSRSDVLTVSRLMLRQKGALFLGVDITATPRSSPLKQFMVANGIANPVKTEAEMIQRSLSGNHAAYYSPTAMNIYNRGLHNRLAEDMTSEEVRAMLMGEWVDKEGKCWKFVEELFPAGNMVNLPYDENIPYILGVDLGSANSAWGLYQRHDLPMGNRKIGCLVLKAEWTPHDVPSWEILRQVQDYTKGNRYPIPQAIKIGHDFKSGGSTGVTADHIFSNILHWNSRVEIISGWMGNKDIQDYQASRAICNSVGERQFLISTQLESHYPGPTRGLMDVMRHDTYPEPGKGRDYFRKEKGTGIFHEDSRDQWLYTMVSVFPPTYKPQENWAA
jgi:hypothetical protein